MNEADRRYLLDTHTFLWMAGAPDRLGSRAREQIESRTTELLLSVASVWEMAIKLSLGKLTLDLPLGDFLRQQLTASRTRLLNIRSEHAIRVATLPWHHRDPFDRLLVSQAILEGTPILSRDPALDAYEIARIW